MTVYDIGNYSLSLAVLAGAIAVFAAIAAVRFDSSWWARAARRAVHAVTALLTVASQALTLAIVGNDFRVDYVVRYSERALPLGYKLAAFWAGQEGSLLLWAWMLAVMASFAVDKRRDDRISRQAPALGILAAAGGTFAALMLFAANPFRLNAMFRLTQVVRPDGLGLNPMLQDPGMIIHPPILFLGYAALTVPFALALGALLADRSDRQWVASARRWALAGWLFLTAGIILGAQWAYVELGWGGYWGWDPVENASLLPWFAATGLIHSLILYQRRGMLKGWSVVLAGLTFLLCIFATYLTRSGIIASVHAFPKSSVGWFFLGMLVVILGFSIAVIIWRRWRLKSEHPLQRLFSREVAFLAVNVLLMIMMLATMIGTMFPIISSAFTDKPVILDAKFYNSVVVPMGLLLAALMGLAPLLGLTRAAGLIERLIVPLIGAVVGAVAGAVLPGVIGGMNVGMIVKAVFAGGASVGMILAAAIAGFGIFAMVDDMVRTALRSAAGSRRNVPLDTATSIRTNTRRYGAMLTHLGMALLVLGVAGSSLFTGKTPLRMHWGESKRVGKYTLTLQSLDRVKGANYSATEAKMVLVEPGGRHVDLRPQLREYDKAQKPGADPKDRSYHSEVSIRTGLGDDVYLILAGWSEGGQRANIQVVVTPLVSWIWIGGIVMGVGSLISIVWPGGRRKREMDPPQRPPALPDYAEVAE